MSDRHVVLVGLGGASCSGKTTLARHLLKILPQGSFVVHQDDIAPPESEIPIHPVHGVADWDDPPGAIDWPRLRQFLNDVKQSGRLPDGHKTYDYLLKPVPVEADQDIIDREKERFSTCPAVHDTIFVLVDGFLAFWDQDINAQYTTRIFVREKKDTLLARRIARQGFITAEGYWIDPPGYFDNIVWPAYIKAHAALFENGDVENGQLSELAKNQGFVLLDASTLGMSGMVDHASRAIYDTATSHAPA